MGFLTGFLIEEQHCHSERSEESMYSFGDDPIRENPWPIFYS
jgi:hypothetical protein